MVLLARVVLGEFSHEAGASGELHALAAEARILGSWVRVLPIGWEDAESFAKTSGKEALKQPILAIGGEANFSPAERLREAYGLVGTDVEVDVVPHAGHWLGRSTSKHNSAEA